MQQEWIQKYFKGDLIIWMITFLFFCISILAVYSATSSLAYRQMSGNTEYYLFKHMFLLLCSIVAMFLVHNIDYRYLQGLAKIGLWISFPLLIITWQYGIKINEASRWIKIPFLGKTFQPSDIAQIALLIVIAHSVYKYHKYQQNLFQVLTKIFFWITAIVGAIALTNLSCALLLFVSCLIILFIGKIPFKRIFFFSFLCLMVGGVLIQFGQRKKTAFNRIKRFVSQEYTYQSVQSFMALATGGIYGKGMGKSVQRNFLPYPYADFIYAIIIEEYGLLGGFLVLLLYCMLLYRALYIMEKVTCLFGALLVGGIAFFITLQALINMAVTVGLLPVTGLNLPLISMGGTSLLFTAISLGVVLSVSRGYTNQHFSSSSVHYNYRKPSSAAHE